MSMNSVFFFDFAPNLVSLDLSSFSSFSLSSSSLISFIATSFSKSVSVTDDLEEELTSPGGAEGKESFC